MMETPKIINQILDKIKKGEPIHQSLPGNGILKMEKPVPFLVLYRKPIDGKNYLTSKLAKTESSYLLAEDSSDENLIEIINAVANALADKFKGFLLVEIWLAEIFTRQAFTVHISQKSGRDAANKLNEELGKIEIEGVEISSKITSGKNAVTPPTFTPLFNIPEATNSGITLIGLEVSPIYLNAQTGKEYPLILRELHSQFSQAMKKSFFEFIRLHSSYNASHFQMLGTTQLDENVFEIDKKLGLFSNQFDFLLLVTPLNTDEAWQDFIKSNYSEKPVFHYRPLPIDPELIKREIYNLPIEAISDPTMAFLFRDKRKEIDRMLDMLSDREKPDFLQSSLQVYGPVEESLLSIAKALLVTIDCKDEPHQSNKKLTAHEFASLAEEELNWMKLQNPQVSNTVRIRDDVNGILVSKGILHINKNFTISEQRAFSILQHEVGTHVLTYYNGKAQPLSLFYTGVPGYEELQEGLAVFSEYLTGGLTPSRMRTLAARVVIVDQLTSGSTFIQSFSLLVEKYNFTKKSAYLLVMRVYRAGGLTKDAVYLKGLLNLIEYIKKGKSLEALLIGKIRQDYLPVVQELIHRNILIKPSIIPRYLDEKYAYKIEEIKNAGNIFNMLNNKQN